MGLPGDERAVLRQIDAGLERDDPDLARRLRNFVRPDGDASRAVASWRPPRVAVAVAAAVAAVAVFLVTVVVLATRHPCAPGTGVLAPATHTVRSPGSSAVGQRVGEQRTAAVTAARSC